MLSEITKKAIRQAYKGRCQYCHALDANHVDHIVALARGGTNDLNNLTLACSSCNTRKSHLKLPNIYEGLLIALAHQKNSKIHKLINNLSKEKSIKIEKIKKPIIQHVSFWELKFHNDNEGDLYSEAYLLKNIKDNTECNKIINEVEVNLFEKYLKCQFIETTYFSNGKKKCTGMSNFVCSFSYTRNLEQNKINLGKIEFSDLAKFWLDNSNENFNSKNYVLLDKTKHIKHYDENAKKGYRYETVRDYEIFKKNDMAQRINELQTLIEG